jgi:hypothetical protein
MPLAITPESGDTSGSFSITNLGGWTDVVIGFELTPQSGGAPDWFAFLLESPGEWMISQFQNKNDNATLARVNLYGVQAVPLPAAFWLFGPALIGFAYMGRRRVLAYQSC